VIHDWKSNWMVSKKEFAGALLEDLKIRQHIVRKLSHAGLSDILIARTSSGSRSTSTRRGRGS